MREALQPPNEPNLYNRIGRFFSIYFTKFFLEYTNLSPNQISILFCISSLISCYFLYLTIITQNILYFFCFAFFLYLYIILDGVDGEVARAKNIANPVTGKVMDVLCHEIFDNAVIIAITLGIYFREKSYLPFFIVLILFFGKNTTRRLKDIIIRTIRLHTKKIPDRMKPKKNKQSKNSKWYNKIIYITTAIPYRGIHLIGFIGCFFQTNILLIVFALWAIVFNLKWIKNSLKFFKSPLTYLPD